MDPGSISTDASEHSKETMSAAHRYDSFDVVDHDRIPTPLPDNYVSTLSTETVSPDQMTSVPIESKLQQVTENECTSPHRTLLPPQPLSTNELFFPTTSTLAVKPALETHSELNFVSNSTVLGEIHTTEALASSVLVQSTPEEIISSDADNTTFPTYSSIPYLPSAYACFHMS